MTNTCLLRNEAHIADVLKLRSAPKCMSAKTFARQKGRILSELRVRSDPPPRLMRVGDGDPADWHLNIRLLLERDGTTVVRGFKLYELVVDMDHWKEPAWMATTHIVVSTVSSSGNVVYTDPTACADGQYIFVPSSRAHTDLSNDQLLSGQWIAGSVVGGNARFCQAFTIHEKLHGRQRGVIGIAPEQVVAKRNVFVRMLPHFVEWYRARKYTNGIETQAELMGAPVFDVGTEVDDDDALAAYNAMVDNPESYVRGILGLKLELKCRQQLMRGELSVEDVKGVFFAHFDSCAHIVHAEQARQLTEKLQEVGFNTMY